MKTMRWSAGIAGLILVLLAGWQIGAATRGLEVITVSSASPPMTIVAPAGAIQEPRPLVLIGHGFAGSSVVMRGFALSLAHAGYTVVLWDFNGHGANSRSMSSGGSLLANAEAALAEAERRGLVVPGRVAIMGHSMGSGVALEFGQVHPETAATIAVSPVGQPVTPSLPRNLLLLAGSLEPAFVRNAEERLAEAGGPGGDPATGTARKMIVISGVEHISILFAPASHTAAREWLDATFGPQPGAVTYTDWRVLWYGFGVLGTLLVAMAAALWFAEPEPAAAMDRTRALTWRLAALLGGTLGAALLLWLVSLAGLGLRGLFGLRVGGYLMVWFCVAGIVGLLLLQVRVSLPSHRAVWGGLLAFAALWLGAGLFGQFVWLHWLLVYRRLLLWPLGALLLLPWFLAVGEAMQGTNIVGWFGWWFTHIVVLAGGLWLAIYLNPELGFIIL
ncbi:MAG: alpha/beta hydrolase [Chloroflexi bacterium]|nr:alpha/beta hydrolase [Chloroflexota bacterium]